MGQLYCAEFTGLFLISAGTCGKLRQWSMPMQIITFSGLGWHVLYLAEEVQSASYLVDFALVGTHHARLERGVRD